MHKGYKCLDRQTGRIYISRDVIFDESRFPFASSVMHGTPSLNATGTSFPQSEPSIMNDHMRKYDLSLLLANQPDAAAVLSKSNKSQTRPDHTVPFHAVQQPLHPVTEPNNPTPVSLDMPAGVSSTNDQTPEFQNTNNIGSETDAGPTSPIFAAVDTSPESASSPSSPAPQHRVVTRSQAGKYFPKSYNDGTVRYDPTK